MTTHQRTGIRCQRYRSGHHDQNTRVWVSGAPLRRKSLTSNTVCTLYAEVENPHVARTFAFPDSYWAHRATSLKHNLPELAYRIACTRHTTDTSSARSSERCRRIKDKIKVPNRVKRTFYTPVIRLQHLHVTLDKFISNCPQHTILFYT
jgi:hypothetical protein